MLCVGCFPALQAILLCVLIFYYFAASFHWSKAHLLPSRQTRDPESIHIMLYTHIVMRARINVCSCWGFCSLMYTWIISCVKSRVAWKVCNIEVHIYQKTSYTIFLLIFSAIHPYNSSFHDHKAKFPGSSICKYYLVTCQPSSLQPPLQFGLIYVSHFRLM